MGYIRINQSIVEKSIENAFITAILGQRRVGKSYFIETYAKACPDRVWAFFNMDDMQQQQRIHKQEFEAMIVENTKQHLGGKNKIWVVVDEAQKCPAIFDQIKILYDRFKGQDKLKVILTGSAVLGLHKLSAESLAGRIELHYLQEFSLREAVRLKETTLPMYSILDCLYAEDPVSQIESVVHALLPFKKLLQDALLAQYTWGGFPETLVMITAEEKITYLNNYLQTYLEKDVRAIETITDLHTYRNLINIIAEQTGSLRDDQRIVSALGCTRDTLKKYRGYLEATLLFVEIYPYINSSLKRLVKSPKGYLCSNGLLSTLTGITKFDLLEKTGQLGHRIENWFLNELNTWRSRHPALSSIHYWRTSSGREVDFIVVQKPEIFPFEITSTTQIDTKKIKNLITFLQEEPKARFAYYIYHGNFFVDKKNRIIGLPAWVIG